ncbi:RNA-directed DNA polymerase, eukaryota [Tanacetum coccineum]
MGDSWLVFEGEISTKKQKPIFRARKHVDILSPKVKRLARVYQEPYNNNTGYVIEGSYTNRSCKVFDESRNVVAEIRRKETETKGVSFGLDVFMLTVNQGFDCGLAMSIVLLLDQMCEELEKAQTADPMKARKVSSDVSCGVGVTDSLVNEAAASIGCSVMKAPFKYLGVMVGGNMSKINAWDDMVGKIKSRLSKWKINTLSIGGRLTLLKAVLGSTPIYPMSLYKVPKTVLHEMESLRRNFFNGVQGVARKISWVKWTKVLASKKYGGLGVSSFYALNRALLFRWVWRFLSHDNSLWFRFISAMHGSSFQTRSSFHCSNWLSIIREVSALKLQGIDFLSHCKRRVGSGMQTRFWEDLWLGEVPFNELFPRLYALENNKECSVAVKMQGEIDSSFRRHVRGGVETQQLENIQDLVRSKVLSNVDDRWAWDLNGDGDFCVKDARDLVDEVLLPKENVATRWIKTIPIKVNVFAWKLHLDRLPTRSNLLKRGIQVQSSLCPICNVLQEDTSHLFFSCDVALAISRLICQWWNVSWSPVDFYSGWLEWFNSIRLGSKLKGILEGSDRKIAWVKWSKVLASKKFGGLGVSSFFALNRALLFKWVWRYLSHNNSLWFRIISALHGLNGYVLSAAFNSTWSSIITEVNSLKVKGVDLISHCKIRVGKGTGTSFWKDLWIGDNLLKLSFPRLFALEENKDISVADKMNTSISSSFRRHVRGGVESQQLDQLSLLLDTVILSNMDDRWFWDLNGDGVFQVKDVRSMLDEAFLPKMEVPTRWIKSIPIKVNVFAWKLYLDRLPTRSNLSRRNVSLPSLACPLCDHVLEDSSHLFFGCSVAKDIQKLICRWWNLDVHPYESYED